MKSSNSELCSYIFVNEHHPFEECLLPSSELKSFTPEINETEKYENFYLLQNYMMSQWPDYWNR